MITFSYKNLKDHIKKTWDENTISHAYCITGPSGAGKELLTQELLNSFYPKKAEQIGNVFQIYPQTAEQSKTKKTRKDITIDQIRDIRSMLMGGSLFSKKRIIIIQPAEAMSSGAANALLKILEEAPRDTIFFLLSNAWHELPETVLSRCQTFHLTTTNKDLAKEVLKQHSTDTIFTEHVIDTSFGLLGNAYKRLTDQELRDEFDKNTQLFFDLIGQPIHEQRKKIEHIFGDKKDHTAQRRKISQLLKNWQCMIDVCIKHNTSPELVPQIYAPYFKKIENAQFTNKKFAQILRSLMYADHAIINNVNPRLLFENIMIKMYA